MLNPLLTCSLQVTQAELHRQFHLLGAGIIEDVRVQRDKGFGFVRYRSHEEAAFAIQAANGRVICGKSVKVSYYISDCLLHLSIFCQSSMHFCALVCVM